MRRTSISVLAVCALVAVAGSMAGCGGNKRSAAADDAGSPATKTNAKTSKSTAATPAPEAKAEPSPASTSKSKTVANETPKPAAPAEAPKPAAPAEGVAVNTICPVTGDLVDPQVPPVVVEINVVNPPLVVSIATSSARAAEIVRANPERYAPAALDNRKATSAFDKRLSQ